MLLYFDQQELTLSQLTSGKIKQNNLSELDSWVVNFIQEWVSGKKSFTLHTSGSTGIPSEIELSREKLIYSATNSLNFLDPECQFKNALLCISPKFIGGMMVIVRALIRNLDLRVTNATSNLADILSKDHYDLVSLVPLQVQSLLQSNPELLQSFRTVLIGGAPLSTVELTKLRNYKHVSFWHTYGMTETASHVAIKNLSGDDSFFQTLGELEISTDDRSCLKMKGQITDQRWLQTNDVVNILSAKTFEWHGRADFVINSGGVKVHPELLENYLSSQIKIPFFVAGLPDERLGEKVVLVLEGSHEYIPDFSEIEKYHRPKAILNIPNFVYTPTGKINRKATLAQITT